MSPFTAIADAHFKELAIFSVAPIMKNSKLILHLTA